MINKVEFVAENHNITPYKYSRNQISPNFGRKTVGSFLLGTMQACEKKPMLNVILLDLITAILPRTLFETFIGSKKKEDNSDEHKLKLNLIGGFEAFRRESSGLLINCVIPGFVVAGVAKLIGKPTMGNFKLSNLTKSWANSDSFDLVQKYYGQTVGKNLSDKSVIENTIKSMIFDLNGVDGSDTKHFSDLLKDKEIDKLFDDISSKIVNKTLTQEDKSKFYNEIVKRTKISENLRIGKDSKFLSSNLNHLTESALEILDGVSKEGLIGKSVDEYFAKAKKLVTLKSIGGLGLVLGLALSAQPINRWITHKISGKKGAPLYNDDKERILSDDEKSKLRTQKAFAIPLMCAVSGLSMFMDRPSLRMFQFKNQFPTMDQARIIATSTFASRIAASEDSNELVENTIRDIATFSSFYFLGDYVAKAFATIMEKTKGVKLLNRLRPQDENASVLKKFWNWAKHTKIKSTDELIGNSKALNLRGWCQFANIGFSLISLGALIPIYTRMQTNKKQRRLEEASRLNNEVFNKSIIDKKSVEFKN